MGDHDDDRIAGFGMAALDQAFDRHARITQSGGQFGEHPRPVGDGQPQVIAPGAAGGRRGGQCGQGGDGHSERRAGDAARDVDEVGDDGAGSGAGPRPAPLEEQPPDMVALGDDGVERPGDGGERVTGGDQRRMDALKQMAITGLGKPDQPDTETQRRRLVEIGEFDGANTLGRHASEVDARTKGQCGENRQLVRRVDAINVEARVGLGEAQCLGVGEHGGERQPLGLHARQDVVAGAVENARDAVDAVGGGTLAQSLDDRNAPGNGGFELQRDPGGFGGSGEFEAVVRQHRLVGGDQRLARRQRVPRQRQRRAIGAADQLDDHIDIVAAGQLGSVVEPGEARQIDPALAAAVAGRHGGDGDGAPGAPRNQCGIVVEQRDDARANGAKAGEADAKGSGHSICVLEKTGTLPPTGICTLR